MEIKVNIETTLKDAEEEMLAYLGSYISYSGVIRKLLQVEQNDFSEFEDPLERLKEVKEDMVLLDKKIASIINTIEEVRHTKRNMEAAGEKALVNSYQQNDKVEGEKDE